MTDARALTDREQEIWGAFYAMRRRLDRALDNQVSRDYGVSMSELEVLVGLIRAPDRQLRVRELATQLGWEKSRVSHQLTRMVHRGLVERKACPGADARAINILLTSEGRRIAVRALPNHVAAIRTMLFDVLDADQQATLLEISRLATAAIDRFDQPDCDETDLDESIGK